METRVLVLLALAATAIAGPITTYESDKCATECTTLTNYNYAPGNTYIYDYSVDTATSMSGASEDTARLTLSTTANIEVLSPCEFALRLTGTRLFHSGGRGGLKAADNENQFRRSLEASSIRFSFQNGVVSNICAGDSEDVWALNIKKGLLSSFQNSMDDMSKDTNVTEVDVSGSCRAEYQVVSNGYYTTSVKKVKDVLTCTDRHSYKSMIQMVPYKLPSDLQSMPLMKTTHECNQEIQKGGVLKSSVCDETHVYRPFSNGQHGGATTVKQTLTYKTSTQGTNTQISIISNRGTLIFDHSAAKPTGQEARLQVERKLKTICASTAYDIRQETPRQFSELVEALRSLDKVEMEDLQKMLKTESLCPTNDRAYKFFLDALSMVSTGASVSLMTSLIINEDVSNLQAKAWIASLAFIKAPTSAMLSDVKALLDSNKFREDALLPVSSMINNFCMTDGSCAQSLTVVGIIASIEKDIGYSCDASGKNFNNIMLSLRALGNAGHSTSAVAAINKCLTYTYNPQEIRVAAANAFRRMPCDAEDSDLWSTFENVDLDSELRIAAFLAIARCPSEKNLARMAASLEKEENDQVGAFVYSHLKNLRQTSDPHKQDIARSMDNLYLSKEFDTNPMKFSRNMEASVLLNKINTGFVAESNLIWSSESQLPRSVSGNLTVDLFGHAVNFVDFGGRLEGLEYLIKNLFGPYMGQEGTSKMTVDDLQGSIYGRIFGNEMLFLHSKQISSPFKNLPNDWMDVLSAMSKKQDMAFTQSAQFMDVSMVIPTSAGLPIHIDVNGTGTVDLVVKGKADLTKLSTSSKSSLDIDGEVRPSAAIEITGSMSVDAAVTKTGLRMRNTIHTSTAMKGRIQMERGQTVNIEFDTPQDKMEVFDASSKFFIVHNDIEQEQQMITKNRKEFNLCSSSQMTKITGVELCGELSFPNASLETTGPFFPLTGPVSASLNLYKKDSHSGYKLFAKRVENKKMSVAQISFNTPGSKVDRAILVDLSVNYPKREIDANLITPWKKASFNGAVITSSKLNSLSGRLTMDNSDIYALTSEVKISESKGKIQFNPMVELRSPGKENIQLTGFVAMQRPMKALDLDLSLSGLQKMPYTIRAAMDNTKKMKSLKVSFSDDGKREYSVEASNSFIVMGSKSTIVTLKNLLKVKTPQRELIDYEGSADYREDKSLKLSGTVDIYRITKSPANINLVALKNAKKRGVRYDIDGRIKSSTISGKLDSNMYIKSSGFISTKNTVSFNIPKVAKNKIVLGGKFNDRSTKAYNKYTLKSNLDVQKNPEYNLGLSFDVDHKKKHSEAEMELKYGPNPKDRTKRIYFTAALNRKIPNYMNADVDYKVKAESPAHNVDIFLTGSHKHNAKVLDSDVKLTYGKGKDVSAGVFLKDASSKLTKVNGKLNLAYPGQEYVIGSQLNQKSAKQYEHDLSFKSQTGTKHSISTVYKMPRPDTYDVVTQFDLDGMKKTTVSGSTTLSRSDFAAAAELKRGKDVYGLSTRSKISEAPSAKVSFEMTVPERRMTLSLDGGKSKNKYEGSVEAAWDADNDKTQKVVIDGSYHHKANKDSVSFGGNLGLNSPFQNFEDLNANLKYGSDSNQHDINTKFSWGGKGKTVLSSFNVQKPFSLRSIVMTMEAKTPFKGYRVMSADIKHSLDKSLSTIIKGRWEKDDAKLAIQGDDNSDKYATNLKGSLSFKSTSEKANDIAATFSHINKAGRLQSNAAYSQDGQTYGYDLTMDHSKNGWQIKNTGDLMLTAPKTKVSTNWNHQNTERDVKSTLTSKWNGDKLFVDLAGSHDVSALRNIDGVLKIQSPWKSFRDVAVSLNHKHGYDSINHRAEISQNGESKAMSSLKYSKDNGNADLDFTLASPFHNDLSGKLSSQYARYPVTSVAEFQWDPRNKVTAESSLNIEDWKDNAIDMKFTTPFRGFRNVLFRASNKKEGEEMVSQMNLDYGVKKSIDVETRHDFEGQNKMARVKVTTPFSTFKSLDTGFKFDGHSTNFDSSADFEILPTLGKFQGSAQMQYDGDLNGKVRIDTPFRKYPYYQLSTSSRDKGNARHSHIEAEYYPRQVYSFDTTYHFDLPISVEATINSPHPEYNDLGLVFQHNMSPSSVATNSELRYQPGKKVEGNLNADWSSNMEGNLLIKTPFQGFETTKVGLRHQGDASNFASHGEVNVAEQSFVADGSYNSGYTTTGTFTLSTPINGMENVAFNMKKKGHGNNIRGDATLTINNDKIDANFYHKLNKDSLKSSFKLSSPYTEDLKLSIDHDGMPKSFTNKMSANYGRQYDIDTIAAFDYREPDVTGNGVLKYKLGGGRNNAHLSFSKSGPVSDMAFSGTAGFNKDDINVNGAWKNLDSIDGNVNVKTPFDGFNDVGMSLSHYGNLQDFRSNANVRYMDNKNIDGKIEMTNNGLRNVRLSSDISTPFSAIPSASLTFNHDYDQYRGSLNGNAALTTPVAEFGTGTISYSKTGSFDNFHAETAINMNGRDVSSLKLSNSIHPKELHSKFNFDSSDLPSLALTLDHMGDLDTFNSKASGILGRDSVYAEISKKGPIDDMSFSGSAKYNRDEINVNGEWKNKIGIDGSIDIKTPFRGFRDVGMSLSHAGQLSDFSSSANLRYMDNHVIAGKVNHNNNYGNSAFNAELNTPFAGYESTKIETQNAYDSYSNDVSGSATLTSTINTFGTGAVKYRKSGSLKNLVVECSIERNGDEISDLKFTNDYSKKNLNTVFNYRCTVIPEIRVVVDHTGDLSNFNSKVSGALGRDSVTGQISKKGALDNFEIETSVDMNGKDISNLKLSNSIRQNEVHSKLNFDCSELPSLALTLDHMGNMDNFNSKASGILGRDSVYGQISKKGPLDNFQVDTSINMNGNEISSLKLSNSISHNELHSKLNFDCSELPTLTVSVDHIGDVENFNSKVSGALGRDSVYGDISKKGPIDDMSFSGSAKYNGDEINVNGEWKNRKDIDGSIDIKTPFRGFRDVGMSLSHAGTINDFSSRVDVRYMDNNKIAGKVTYGNCVFNAELTTPFKGFESTKVESNNACDSYSNDISGSATLSSTINSFGTGTVKYSKSGSLKNLVVECSLVKDGNEIAKIEITNDFSDKNLNTVFKYQCTVMPEISFTIQHNGDMNNFNTKTQGSIGKYNVVSGEANLNQRGDNIDADASFMYNTENYGGNQVSVNFHKDGPLNNFNFKANGKLNNKESSISGSLKTKDEITGSLRVHTPVRGYSNVGMSFKHSGNLANFNSEGDITLYDGQKYSGKVDFYCYLLSRVQTTAELQTPISGYEFTKFEYRHEEDRDGFKCYSTLEYGESKKITYDMSVSVMPQPDFSVSIKTPFENFEEMMASATVESNWPKYGITSKVNAGSGRIITLNGAFDASNDISGSLSVSTPVDGFTDVGANFDFSGKPRRFTTKGRVTYMDGQDISGKVDFRLRGPRIAAELKTPFSGLEFTSYELTVSNTDAETSSASKLVYGDNKVISSNTIFTYMPKPGFTITYKTPFYGYEDMMVAASAEGDWPKYAFNSKLNAGRNQIYTFSGAFDAANDISGSLGLSTPFDGFTDIGASFQHSGNAQKFDSEAKITYLDNKDIIGKVNFYRYMWRRLVATAELSTPFSGMEKTKTELNYEDNSNSISTTAALEYGNDQKMNGNMKLTYSPTYDALITINTPFYDYRVIRAQGSLDTNAPSYSASGSLNYGYNQAYSANSKLNFYSADNLDGIVEVSLPVSGYEMTKVEYKHKVDPSRVDGSASLTYGNGKVISADLKSIISPNFDATLDVRTPFPGYKKMQATTTFDKGYKKYDASTSLKLGRGMRFSMTSGLDYSVEPLRATTKIFTPYSDFSNVELVVTHEGELNNFYTTGFFSSPITDNINAQAKLKYSTPSDMLASASFQSSLVGMDDLKAELKNSDTAGEKKSHAVVGWTSGQEIILDSVVRNQEGWYENKFHSDVSVSTPFIAVKNVALRVDHTGKQNGISENIDFELNGDKLLDVSGDYSSKDKREATVTFRQPWPMQYTATMDTNNQMIDTEIVANWNRDAVDSNVKLTATVGDKSDDYQMDRSLDIAVEHANRKMGVSHKLASSTSATSSNGKVYWDKDDSSKVSYDFQLNDNSRRRKEMKDGSFKLGLPSRTLAVSGSYSDNSVVKATDATFSWDAGRDDSQQVGVKASMTRGDRAKGDITLSMPSFRKEIRVESEMMMQDGRVIFDTKTDISYSPDSRKKLTLMSKLEDTRDYYSHYNYSLELGIIHPYTNVDVRMVSHLGSSDQKMTVGMETQYMTARRQSKNIALLAEINKLKKEINVQFKNPMNKIEMMGNVVSTSPYKVNFVNKIDDVEAFQADFTMDSEKKALKFSANMDNENLVISALYPNNSAFRTEVSRHSTFRDMTEGLFTMRLNTSRLLHTRIHWNPEVMEELRGFVKETLSTKGVRALETFTVMNEAVAEELSGKYNDISKAFVEDARPLVDQLHREMAMLSKAISDLSEELRVMYQNNDYYIQDFASSYMELQERLENLNSEYKAQYTAIIRSLGDGLNGMLSYNVRDEYFKMVDSGVNWFNTNLEEALSCLEKYLSEIDATLQEYKESYGHIKAQAKDMILNNTYVDYMSNQIDQLADVDIRPYVTSFSIPEEYTNAIYSINSAAIDRIGAALDRPGIRYIKGGMNEVYQQGVWAYNYWQLEKNIHKHAKSIIELIREIIEEEVKEYVESAKSLYRNPITVWDPKNGEVQAEFVLPVDVHRLDEMPDLSPLVERVEALSAQYLPDASTLEAITDTVSDMWPEDILEGREVKKSQPKRKLRKLRTRKYKVKKYRQ